MTRRWLCPVLLLLLLSSASAADAVVGWRGNGVGRYPEAKPPKTWSATTAVWKTEVGMGYSSPVVSAGRMLVTADPDLLVCLDTKTGKRLWQQRTRIDDLPAAERPTGKPPATACGYTTPTPVTDGKRVWVVLGTGLAACYDMEGKRIWLRLLDNSRPPQYGRSASPLLVGDRLVVLVSRLLALDATTGKTLWTCDKVREGYGSPAQTRIGREEVIVTASGEIVRVRDGKVLALGVGRCVNATPLCLGRMVYFIEEDSVAIELPDKAADTIAVRKVWTAELAGEFFASPVEASGRIWSVNKSGTLYAVSTATGKVVLEKDLSLPRMPRPAPVPTYYPSLALVGEWLFVGHNGGGSVWLSPGREYREVGRQLLGPGAAGTPTFAGKQVFLRSGGFVYAIGER
jgi:hypothetical protein